MAHDSSSRYQSEEERSGVGAGEREEIRSVSVSVVHARSRASFPWLTRGALTDYVKPQYTPMPRRGVPHASRDVGARRGLEREARARFVVETSLPSRSPTLTLHFRSKRDRGDTRELENK